MTGSNKMHFATTAKVLYISKWAYKKIQNEMKE